MVQYIDYWYLHFRIKLENNVNQLIPAHVEIIISYLPASCLNSMNKNPLITASSSHLCRKRCCRGKGVECVILPAHILSIWSLFVSWASCLEIWLHTVMSSSLRDQVMEFIVWELGSWVMLMVMTNQSCPMVMQMCCVTLIANISLIGCS